MSCRTPFTAHFAATFTTLGFRKKNLFIIFYYVHYAMVMSKRSKILFQRYVHDAMIMKNIRFTLGFIKNTLIATTSTTSWSWQKSIFFLFSTTALTTPWWWEKSAFSLVANCYYVPYVVIMSKKYFPHSYYVHYAVIMTKIYVFISALRVLYDDHDKKYTFFHFSTMLSRS